MSRRRRFNATSKRTSTFGLNITSLTDMFTILLVFLLQNFAATEIQIEPVAGLRLPTSTSELNPVEGARLILTKDELKVGDLSIAMLKDLQFKDSDTDPKDPNYLPLLFNELNRLAQDQEKAHLKEGRVLFQADASLPYSTLRKVLYTASMAGFPQLKMVTTIGN
jgi:biopolymer transport protein ExbD